MKVNLGCGEFPLAGYCNVDIRALPGVDRVADLRTVEFHEPIERVYAGHVIEHLTQSEACAQLERWWGFLGEGGDLTVTIPDADKAVLLLAEGQLTATELALIVGGEQSCPEMKHRSVWSLLSLVSFLETLPEVQVDYVCQDPRCPAHPPWQTTIKATRVYRA